MKLNVILALILSALSFHGYACKVRSEPHTYPMQELQTADTVVILKVMEAESREGIGYPITNTMTAVVIESLKGEMPKGTEFDAFHREEEAHAICPAYFKVGNTYLVPLFFVDNKYVYSRYTLTVSSDSANFVTYVRQLKNGI